MWKVSQSRLPTWLLTGLEYHPAIPPSGMTTMRSLWAVAPMMSSSRWNFVKFWTPPWRRYITG